MRLLRYGEKGAEKPAMLDQDGNVRDLSGIVPDIAGDVLGEAGLQRLRDLDPGSLPQASANERIGPCVGGVGKIICVGLNYSDHAEESGAEVPPEPIIFAKATSSINGPNDTVEIPRDSVATDWEVELAIIIGKEAKYVSEGDAMDHVAGFCIVNDISERDFQIKRSGQWVKGKSADTFAPMGPWLVTKDEISDPQNLKMTLDVNGKRYQDGTTATMVYKIPFLVSYISRFMSLQPGDIIPTGTPPGVGMGQNPPVYLKPGDVMELSIEGLGSQRQSVASA